PEKLANHPRSRARVPVPVVVELRDEHVAQRRLQLPRPEVARRVEPRVHVDERVSRAIPERRRAAQDVHIRVGERRPRYVTSVETQLVTEVGTVSTKELQLFECPRPAIFAHPRLA